ncbi:MAG: iron complex outermembrane receptor protein [Salibacteraceae bacterium]|jgi:outer membrane receptor protein involved in Fe transport
MANFYTFIKLTLLLLVPFLGFSQTSYSQNNTIKGKVIDNESGETVIGASVVIKGTTEGITTDIDGNFTLVTASPFPITLTINSMGYSSQELIVENETQKIKVKMKTSDVVLQALEVVDSRISDKQKESALTVESMDITAIKESASGDFYQSLGNMKGVDMTSASIGFKVINTRGFNSTSPVRSLQVIDGVDNQSPGLNFSLGNFLGSSELDVKRVNIVAGASSAYYGPGAFNGVVAFETKDPFYFPGLSASIKVGERNLTEVAIRWAQSIKNKKGEEKFGYKLNFFYFQAYDWEADNYDATEDSPDKNGNPGGWDGVNTYGDENVEVNNDYTGLQEKKIYPGLNQFYRTGYKEEDITDYNTNNTKANVGLYYKINKDVMLSYGFNYGTGTTIYQGDNRFKLDGIQFVQNKIEIAKKDKWFVRAYATNENAGKSYDIYTAGLKLQDRAIEGNDWNTNYSANWRQLYSGQVRGLPGYPQSTFPLDEWAVQQDSFLALHQDSLVKWHSENREITDKEVAAGQLPRYEPGTARFNQALNDVINTRNIDGGAQFVDKSALYHVQGQYKFEPTWGDIVVGADARMYRPYSEGTIFRDTISYVYENGVKVDSTFNPITNYQFGVFAGVEYKMLEDDALKMNFTLRMDKNENFNVLLSPALSLVYTTPSKHTFRATLSSAIRNPTLADQYLYLDVGRAILLGNLDGFDSLVTIESFNNYRRNLTVDTLEYFNVAPVVPEKVKTIELGYRGNWGKKIYVDMEAYHSWYTDFIGYNIGLDLDINSIDRRPSYLQAYRLATNATSGVTTLGYSVGLNYYFAKNYTLNGNYSYNALNKQGSDDPLIPAYNTPRNKFNLGITARDLTIPFTKKTGLGFGVNLKWIEGFVFEGSPQFSGSIPSYALLDAQVNYVVKKINTTFKFGASNLMNNMVSQVYGGPRVGRMAYASIIYDWKPKN